MTVKGEVVRPEAFETNTGKLFDYPQYLRAHGVSVLMRYGTVQKVEAGGWSVRGVLFAIKHRFEASLRHLLPEPGVSLMEGMLLGERRGVPDDLNRALMVVGLIHIVVLSGYNISVVAEQALRVFALFLSRRVALLAGAVAIILFALTVGAGATVVRATLMGLIALLARVLRRPTAALRALGVTALAMALWNPLVIFDPSYVLSVLATFGLITLSPMVETWLTWVPEWGGVRSVAASTIAVQMYVLPALLAMTGLLSLFALVANVLVLPLVPSIMLAGFVAGVLGLVHTAIALPFAVLAQALVIWVVWIAEGVASLPFASTVVSSFSWWWAALLYVPLTAFATWHYLQSASRSHPNSNF